MFRTRFYKLLLVTFCALFTSISLTQNLNADSLETVLIRTKNVDDRYRLMCNIFDAVEYSDPSKSLVVARELFHLAPLTKDPIEAQMYSLNLMGIAFMNQGLSDSAFFYFTRLADFATQQHNDSYTSKAYNNLGALSINNGNIDDALTNLQKSIEINEESGNNASASSDYLNVASMYYALGSIDSARNLFLKGIELAGVAQDTLLLTIGYRNLALLESSIENYDKSREYNLFAVKYGLACGDIDDVASAYYGLGIGAYRGMNYNDAVEYYLDALKYAKQSDDLNQIAMAYNGLAFAFEKLGLYKEAFENQILYGHYTDSSTEIQNRQNYIEMQEKYKSEETKKENEILTQKNKIQNLEIAKSEEEIQNSRIVITSSIIGLFLLIVLAVMLYNRNVIKQRANQKLQEANAIIREKNTDILASIEYASKIQEALLPTSDNPNLFKDSFFLLRPKDIVSGDFLWYSDTGEKKVFAAVDCTGHGVPGAFMSMIGNTYLHQIINERGILDPAEILNELRRSVVLALNQKGRGVNRKDGMDMGICVVNELTGTLEFAGANNPLFLIRSGKLTEVKGDKQPVGFFEGKEKSFTKHQFPISSGDCIYLLSDGYVDQFGGPKGKKFKYRQLLELIQEIHERPMQTQKVVLNTRFEEWKGSLEQVDDVCVIGVRITG